MTTKMTFVKTFHVDDEDLNEGECTFGEHAPAPRFTVSCVKCPFCGGVLRRATNAGVLKIHRVARVLGERRGGQTPFLGSLFPSRTHVFLGCKSCRIGFSTLKSP